MNQQHKAYSLNDLAPAPDIQAFTMEDEMILFQSRSGRICRLNQTASVIWQGLSSQIPVQEIAQLLANGATVHHDDILQDIEQLVEQWTALGIVYHNDLPSPPVDKKAVSEQQHVVDLEPGETLDHGVGNQVSMAFKIIDADFFIELSSTDVFDLVRPLFSHLNTRQTTRKGIRLRVVRSNLRYLLFRDDIPIDWCRHQNGIAPMVHANAMMIAYDLAEDPIGVHSAAVEINGRSIMFPALSGSGKSTLTAAMVAAGFNYLADDWVLLTDAPVRMRPVPVAMGLKKGVWDILATDLPPLAGLVSHLRADDKWVRYFVPEKFAQGHAEFAPRQVDAMVFPKFEAEARLTFAAIKPAEALCRMTEAGYNTQGGLTVNVVNQLIQWISSLPCYEVRYSSLKQALEAIESIAR